MGITERGQVLSSMSKNQSSPNKSNLLSTDVLLNSYVQRSFPSIMIYRQSYTSPSFTTYRPAPKSFISIS